MIFINNLIVYIKYINNYTFVLQIKYFNNYKYIILMNLGPIIRYQDKYIIEKILKKMCYQNLVF